MRRAKQSKTSGIPMAEWSGCPGGPLIELLSIEILHFSTVRFLLWPTFPTGCFAPPVLLLGRAKYDGSVAPPGRWPRPFPGHGGSAPPARPRSASTLVGVWCWRNSHDRGNMTIGSGSLRRTVPAILTRGSPAAGWGGGGVPRHPPTSRPISTSQRHPVSPCGEHVDARCFGAELLEQQFFEPGRLA